MSLADDSVVFVEPEDNLLPSTSFSPRLLWHHRLLHPGVWFVRVIIIP